MATERKGNRGKVHGWESEQAGMGAGEKVFCAYKEGRKEVMQRSEECKIAQAIPQRLGCVKGPHARRVTDGKAPGTNHRQMTSDRRGNGDIGLKGTRRICRPPSKDGRTALIAS